MRWHSDASMGRCFGTSRIYWVCKYSRAPAMKKEAINEKRPPGTQKRGERRKLNSQVRILGHIKNGASS
jgi:hypothetical protein